MSRPERRWIIVNADDFGLSLGTNQGIIAAHEKGIVTSTSLMVRQLAVGDAARYARNRDQLSVGLHVDLGEWVWTDGAWKELDHVVDVQDDLAVQREITRQLDVFHDLLGRNPTHLDSHQHVHRTEPVRSAVCECAAQLGIPVRHFTEDVVFCGGFYGQGARNEPYPEGIDQANLLDLVGRIPGKIIEVGCHPGLDAELASSYRQERLLEVRTLCDPLVQTTLLERGVTLVSYAELPRLRGELQSSPGRNILNGNDRG